jgi:hypothetical protein
MFAAYNVITAPKELLLALETGHATSAEQAARINAWILQAIARESRAMTRMPLGKAVFIREDSRDSRDSLVSAGSQRGSSSRSSEQQEPFSA